MRFFVFPRVSVVNNLNVCIVSLHPGETMPAHRGKFVAYYRVSTDKQCKSGLGLDAQRRAVRDYLNGGTWHLIGEFTEIESGKRNERPELVKALAVCKRQKAKLVIAKLDRLSRNLAFIATLMDSGVEFVAVDNPHANKRTVHILAIDHRRCALLPFLNIGTGTVYWDCQYRTFEEARQQMTCHHLSGGAQAGGAQGPDPVQALLQAGPPDAVQPPLSELWIVG